MRSRILELHFHDGQLGYEAAKNLLHALEPIATAFYVHDGRAASDAVAALLELIEGQREAGTISPTVADELGSLATAVGDAFDVDPVGVLILDRWDDDVTYMAEAVNNLGQAVGRRPARVGGARQWTPEGEVSVLPLAGGGVSGPERSTIGDRSSVRTSTTDGEPSSRTVMSSTSSGSPGPGRTRSTRRGSLPGRTGTGRTHSPTDGR